MKKFLFKTISSTLMVLVIWFLGFMSHTYAQSHGPKIDWDGKLFEWSTIWWNIYYTNGWNPLKGWRCGAWSSFIPNWLPTVGLNLSSPANCQAMRAPHPMPTVAYVPDPTSGFWYRIMINNNGVITSREQLTLTYNHKIQWNGSLPSVEQRDVQAPIYQTGKPYRPVCDVNSNGAYDDNNSAYCNATEGLMKQGVWHPYSSPQRCSPYAKNTKNYHEILPFDGMGINEGIWSYNTNNANSACVEGELPGGEIILIPDPVCGTSHWGTFFQQPTTNLCIIGGASAVAGSGPWNWTCTTPGFSVSCSANQSVASIIGKCGSANGVATSQVPANGLCDAGLALPNPPILNGNNYTWMCMGVNGGSNASCSAPQTIVTGTGAAACVPYNPLAVLPSTSIIPSTQELAVSLNAPQNGLTGNIRSVTSSWYTFTGSFTTTKYLQVTLTNLAWQEQFIQYRNNQFVQWWGQNNSQKSLPIESTSFYGCNAPQWNVSNPLLWNYNLGFTEGMMADRLFGDIGRWWVYPNNPVSQFYAWNKGGKGFKVNCEVCSYTAPVGLCTAKPANSVRNTVSTVTGNPLPSIVSVYNTIPSNNECRFKCNAGYQRDGAACTLTLVAGTCQETVGQVCTNNSQCGTGGTCTNTTTQTAWMPASVAPANRNSSNSQWNDVCRVATSDGTLPNVSWPVTNCIVDQNYVDANLPNGYVGSCRTLHQEYSAGVNCGWKAETVTKNTCECAWNSCEELEGTTCNTNSQCGIGGQCLTDSTAVWLPNSNANIYNATLANRNPSNSSWNDICTVGNKTIGTAPGSMISLDPGYACIQETVITTPFYKNYCRNMNLNLEGKVRCGAEVSNTQSSCSCSTSETYSWDVWDWGVCVPQASNSTPSCQIARYPEVPSTLTDYFGPSYCLNKTTQQSCNTNGAWQVGINQQTYLDVLSSHNWNSNYALPWSAITAVQNNFYFFGVGNPANFDSNNYAIHSHVNLSSLWFHWFMNNNQENNYFDLTKPNGSVDWNFPVVPPEQYNNHYAILWPMCVWAPNIVQGEWQKNRTVVCRNSSGAIVNDSLCPQPKPSTTGVCGAITGECTLDTTRWGSCFVADTLVTLADGSSKPIQDIAVGDELKAVSGSNTVIALIKPLLGNQNIYSINNKDAFFTANHPFLTTEWWKSFDPETTKKEIPDLKISKLEIGDILITEGEEVLITNVFASSRDADTQLYNFELDGDHTYYANGYAVHNKYEPGSFDQNLYKACTRNNDCFTGIGGKPDLYCDNGSKTCKYVKPYPSFMCNIQNGVLTNRQWAGCGDWAEPNYIGNNCPGSGPTLELHQYTQYTCTQNQGIGNFVSSTDTELCDLDSALYPLDGINGHGAWDIVCAETPTVPQDCLCTVGTIENDCKSWWFTNNP